MALSLVGSPAPGFCMASTKSPDLDQPVSLHDYRGRWLVLVFYPADFTFVCPTEMLAFSQAAPQFETEQASLLGISSDGVHCHEAWQEFVLGRLAFPLAADPTLKVCRDYGVLIEDEGVAQRALFIVDPDGTVRYQVVHDDDVGRSVDESLRVLRALRAKVSVPVDWQPGKATLAR
ncbi:MAG: peroxiredoxin [Solirubrobacterales bacterium]|nr:peroxiredoxin [Solirubrobacterales bacterium]